MSTSTRALLESFLRVFTAASLACYLQLGKAPLDLDLSDAKQLVNAGLAAAILTLFNFVRGGETRFGRGSEDIGMGGDDELKPGGVVDVPEPRIELQPQDLPEEVPPPPVV